LEDFNGAVNFVLGNLQENAVPATAKTARLFLGMQVQCTQCHNHPFNDWKQDQFWELNSFYRQAKVQSQRAATPAARLLDVDFAGDGEVYWEMRNGLMKVSYPTFVDGTAINPSGAVSKVNRRDELARLVARSSQLPRAIANRLWGHFLGYGFTRPVDDMGPHNPPSHPELLVELAAKFRESGFDMPRLMRWIVLSEAYGLSSRVGAGNEADDPAAGATPRFSRFYVRQMQAEQLYESLLAATDAAAGLAAFDREAMRLQWLRQMNTATGNDEGTESTTFNGSIPQALMMMNGELVRRASSVGQGSFLDQVARDPLLSNRQKIQRLYRAALARMPTREEAEVGNRLLEARRGDVLTTLQDVWWAVLNCNEFILVH
jgi:hypothetical protein